MTRKDSEKDAERPHYYSQFWLDIAAGRRVIGGPKPEEAEANEAEAPELAPTRKTGRNADALREIRASAVVEPEVEEEEELEQENTVDEADLPNIVFDDDSELAADAAMEDFNEDEPEPEEDDFFEDEEDEEEDEEEWGRRGGRKKPKPTRPARAVKRPKRETRRNF